MHLIDSIDDHNFIDFDTLVNQEPKDIYLIEYVDISFSDKRVSNTKLYSAILPFLTPFKSRRFSKVYWIWHGGTDPMAEWGLSLL